MPKRHDLANFLRDFGEDDLAARALTTSDQEMDRIAILAAHYAFSNVATAYGGSMGSGRALSLAALDVLEGTGRNLRRTRSQAELNFGWPEELDQAEVERIRAVRRTAPQ